MNDVPGLIAGRLVVAQRSMATVGRDATNNFHKYAYVSAERMIEVCREALTGAQLALARTGWTLNIEAHTVTSTFRLWARDGDAADGVTWTVDWPVIEDKGRPFDKALGGALTTSLSYVLRDLLLVAKGDEADEMDRRDDRGHKPGTYGTDGAAMLQRRLAAAKLDMTNLVQAIAKAEGVEPPLDVARWPRTWEPRINAWMTRNAPPAKDATP